MRLFLSIPLSPAVLDALSAVQQQLVAAVGEEHLKLVKPTDFYCTRLSLGDRDASQWEGVVDASVVVAASGQPFDMHLSGVKSFPKVGPARTVLCPLVGSGLLPVLGIHHRNKYNAYCLADDVMEPYRPIIDRFVFAYLKENENHLTDTLQKKDREYLLGVTTLDVDIEGKTSPLLVGVQRTTASLMKCYMGERRKIAYPIL